MKQNRHGYFIDGKYPPAYGVWNAMKQRCYNSKVSAYKDYGGRGITVCQRWLDDFHHFYIDMGQCPVGYSLDRIDNDKGYYKENCKWSTPKEQANNRRNQIVLCFNGQCKTLSNWAQVTGFNIGTLRDRYYHRWSPKDILTHLPVMGGKRIS